MKIYVNLLLLSLAITCDGSFFSMPGYLLVAGGKDRMRTMTDTKQFYSLKHKKWVTEKEISKKGPGSIFTSSKGFMPVPNSGFYIFPQSKSHETMMAGGELEATFVYSNIYSPHWPALPLHPENELRQRACGASLYGNAFLFGGFYSQREIAVFSPHKNRWNVVKNDKFLLPLETEGCGAVGHEGVGYIYICGHSDFDVSNIDNDRSKACMKYNGDTQDPEVYHLNPMNYGRTGNFLAAYGDYIYAVGGNDEHGAAERLHVRGGMWEEIKSSMDVPRKFSLALSDKKGNIYLIGGGKPHLGYYVLGNTVEKYCTLNEKWTRLSDIPEARFQSAGLYFQ